MPSRIVLTGPTYRDLYTHLLKENAENVAFLFTDAEVVEDSVVFQESGLYLVQPDEFLIQSGYHVSLTDECLAKVIKMAWDRQSSLVEFHSHPSGRLPAEFSHSDLHGFQDFVPHIQWRLKERPFAAVVVAPMSFDAMVWTDRETSPGPLDALEVDGDRHAPTGITLSNLRGRHGRE